MAIICFEKGEFTIRKTLDENEWTKALLQFSDSTIYQTIEFSREFNLTKKFSPYLIYRNDELFSLIITRDFNIPLLNIYRSLNGPITKKINEQFDIKKFLLIINILNDFIVTKKKSLLFIKPYLFKEKLNHAEINLINNLALHQRAHYETFILEINNDLDKLKKGFEHKWRNHLNKAEKSELKVTKGTDELYQKNFLKLFDEMVSKKSFKVNVDPHIFLRLNQSLDERIKMQIFLCFKDNELIAGSVISKISDYAIYLFGATNDLGRKFNASYLIHYKIIEWLISQKTKFYDLGGIDEIKNPGVFNFKKGFNGVRSTKIPGIIISPNKYLDLIARKILK